MKCQSGQISLLGNNGLVPIFDIIVLSIYYVRIARGRGGVYHFLIWGRGGGGPTMPKIVLDKNEQPLSMSYGGIANVDLTKNLISYY